MDVSLRLGYASFPKASIAISKEASFPRTQRVATRAACDDRLHAERDEKSGFAKRSHTSAFIPRTVLRSWNWNG
ncbi:MAG TPA: hypothetical protein VMV10_17890 [Pirellulales bacterium]|nr:hypothetical protein [Pirellulales bacterium]